jgi:amidohydrolase
MKHLAAAAYLLTVLAGAPLARADALSSSVKAQMPELMALYTHLHRHPELSYQEEKTADRMAEELRKAGYVVTQKVGGHGVVGVLSNGTGPVLLLRADMDGLPVKEQTGLAFASTATAKAADGSIVPVMHACGHDIHMTAMIGTARQMASRRADWSGTLVIVMQPAEEVGGSHLMLDDGLYRRFPKPSAAIALHDSASLPTGMLGWNSGYVMAAVDSVDIEVRGVGGHGAYPHTTKDPVVIAAQIVTALQTLVSRETDPQDAAVVTVGSIHGGSKHNIISDTVYLQLTVRSYAEETRKRLLDGIRRIARAQALSAGVPEDRLPVMTMKDLFTPATWNTPAQSERLAQIFSRRFGADRVVRAAPSMGGEDFSRYWLADRTMESTLFWLGAVKPADYEASKRSGAALPSLHSPFWAPDAQPTLQMGIEALTTAALDVLKKR